MLRSHISLIAPKLPLTHTSAVTSSISDVAGVTLRESRGPVSSGDSATEFRSTTPSGTLSAVGNWRKEEHHPLVQSRHKLYWN